MAESPTVGHGERTGMAEQDMAVTDLVTRARYGLGDDDAHRVGQNVWLHPVEHLDKSRDPAALPGSLATTARHESCRALREARRPQTVGYVLDIENIPNQQDGIAGDELLHRRAERQTRAHAGARTGTWEGERRMWPNKS